MKDRDVADLVDLPVFGRPARLVSQKIRWCCPDADCLMTSWTWGDSRIGARGPVMIDLARRWVIEQVGRYARSVNEIARELGCHSNTINDAGIAYRGALVQDPARFDTVEALGLDETLFARLGYYHRRHCSTSIVDAQAGQLLDVFPGRTAKATADWLESRGWQRRKQVQWATLDLSGPYRAVLDLMLSGAGQVADAFHPAEIRRATIEGKVLALNDSNYYHFTGLLLGATNSWIGVVSWAKFATLPAWHRLKTPMILLVVNLVSIILIILFKRALPLGLTTTDLVVSVAVQFLSYSGVTLHFGRGVGRRSSRGIYVYLMALSMVYLINVALIVFLQY